MAFGCVHGSTYPGFKLDFINELHDVFDSATYPILVCGDFNLVRGGYDQSSGLINHQSTLLFNDWINRWGLLEISISNRNYTWSNNQDPFCYLG